MKLNNDGPHKRKSSRSLFAKDLRQRPSKHRRYHWLHRLHQASANNRHPVGDKIFQTIDRIEKNPLAFRECWEIPTKTKVYRQAVCMSWLIIYRVKGAQIVILGIIHSSRKPSRIRSLKKIK